MNKIDKTKAIVACNYDTMTSLEVAELTGMRHDHLLRDIRKMEEGWIETNHSKFEVVEYVDAKGEKRPMYQLNKEEWLYIATKFDVAARAKLILRWEYKEKKNLKRMIERENTNKIYKALFGMNAKQIREYLKLDKNANIREHISAIAIRRISALEEIAQHLVDMGCNYDMVCEEIDNIVQKQNFGIALTQLKAA